MRVSPGQCVHNAVGGGANANHHSRAVNHRLLGTIWGQTKLGFTLGGHLVVVPRHGVVWAREGGGGAAAGSVVLGSNLTTPWQSLPTPLYTSNVYYDGGKTCRHPAGKLLGSETSFEEA